MKRYNSCYFAVTERPKIAPVLSKIHLKAGKQASIPCILEQGSAPIEFEWLKENDVIRSSGKAVVEKNQRSSNLIIQSITITDTGNYTCKASNSFGLDIFTSQLTVEGLRNFLSF